MGAFISLCAIGGFFLAIRSFRQDGGIEKRDPLSSTRTYQWQPRNGRSNRYSGR